MHIHVRVNNINWNSGILEFLKYGTIALRQEAKLKKENVIIVDIEGKTSHHNNMEQQRIAMNQSQSTFVI